MGNVEGWKTFAIEQCCDILDSKRVPVNSEDRDRRIGEIPYYGANGLQGYIDDYLFDEPLILIAEDGGCFDEFATRPIAYRISGRSWVNNHAHILRAKDGFCQDAIFYSLEHKDIQSFIVGGTRSKLNQSALRSILIELPQQKKEQAKIAEILSTVDSAIEQTEALIAKQQRIKTGLMQGLLTRGIDEHGNLRSEQTHKFKDSPLGRIPVEWEVNTLDSCVRNDGPICYGILMPGTGCDNGVPVIKVKDVVGGKILQNNLLLTDPQIDNQYKRSKLRCGDLLITIRGTTGRIAIVPVELDGANITQDTARIRLKGEYSNIYFYFRLQSKHVQNQVLLHTLGQAVKGINIAEVKKLLLGLPALNEQEMIAERLNEMEESLGSTDHELNKLNAIKTALMQDLLTGRKRITQLPNNEKTTN